MRSDVLPIILGRSDDADKCIIAGRDRKLGGYSLWVCRLKAPQERGTAVELENVAGYIGCLHFCRLQSAQAFRDGVAEMVKMWEERDNDN